RGDRTAGLGEHREAVLEREQRRLAGVHADRQYQTVGKPYRLPDHVEMAIGNGVERPGIERNSRHSRGLARRPHCRKAITDRSRICAFPLEPYRPISRLTQWKDPRRDREAGTGWLKCSRFTAS